MPLPEVAPLQPLPLASNPTYLFLTHLPSPTPPHFLTHAHSLSSPQVPLPEVGPLKPRLFNMAYEELSNWINRATPLVPTALYGIRVYTNKSTLAMHVDRWDTHVVSAIINVDQDTAKPWPLQITDHAGEWRGRGLPLEGAEGAEGAEGNGYHLQSSE